MRSTVLAADGGILIAAVAGVLLVFVLPLWGAADAAMRPDLDWGRIERSKTTWVLLQVFVFPFAAYYFSVVRPELKVSARERRRITTYRPPRSRRELGTAIACATTVVVVTAALVWLLRPTGDDAPEVPPIDSLPPELSIPTDSLPPDATVPLDTTPTTPAPAP